MSGLNRFRPLKRVRGAEQVVGVPEYKAAKLDEGLCAAMSMRWLKDGTVPTEFSAATALQAKYAAKLKEKKGQTGPTIEYLAGQCGLKVQGRTATGTVKEATSYWRKKFGDGQLGAAMLTYANGQMKRQMNWDVLDWETADTVPSFIWVHLNVPEVEVFGETLKDGNAVEFEGGETVTFAGGVLTVKDKKTKKYQLVGEHGIALARVDGGYRYFDPNAGEYEVSADALGTFFDKVWECYQNFYAGLDPTGELTAAVDLQLVRIYAVRELFG